MQRSSNVFINLVILLLLMKKFLFGPVTKMLDEDASKRNCRHHHGAQRQDGCRGKEPPGI